MVIRSWAGLAVAALMIGACASGTDVDDPPPGSVDIDFAAVAARSGQFESVSMRVSVSQTFGSFLGQNITFNVVSEGVSDLTTGDAEFTIQAVDVTGSTAAPRLPAQVDSIYRKVGNTTYISPPPIPQDGVVWLAIETPTDPTAAEGKFDATAVLDELAAFGDPDLLGSEVVEGRSTQHYRATARFIDVLEAGGGSLGEFVADLQAQFGTLNIELPSEGELRLTIGTLPVRSDVWIDDDGLFRQLQIEQDFGAMFDLVLSAADNPDVSEMFGSVDLTMVITSTVIEYGGTMAAIEAPIEGVLPVTSAEFAGMQQLAAHQAAGAAGQLPQPELTPEQIAQRSLKALAGVWTGQVERVLTQTGSYPVDRSAVVAGATFSGDDLVEYILDTDGFNYCLVVELEQVSPSRLRYATHGWGSIGEVYEFDPHEGTCQELLSSF